MGTILLADDNPDDVILTEIALKRARLGNPLRTVGDGEQAIAYLEGSGVYGDRDQFPFPILLLLDLNMPRVNGFDVLEWLRRQPYRRKLSVAVWTDSDTGPNVRRAYDLGADTYLIKPANSEALLALVQRLKGYWYITTEASETRTSAHPVSSKSKIEAATHTPSP